MSVWTRTSAMTSCWEPWASRSDGGDITSLVHVRSRAEIKAAEEVTRRAPCPNFPEYKAIFDQVRKDLASGARQTVKFGGEYADIKQGDLFILEGRKVLWSPSARVLSASTNV